MNIPPLQGRAECEAPGWGHAGAGYGAARHHPARLACCRMRVRGGRSRRSRRAVIGLVEGIAGAANGADRIRLAGGAERLAQAADMDVDRALVHVSLAAPDAVEELLAREHPPGLAHEELEQLVF